MTPGEERENTMLALEEGSKVEPIFLRNMTADCPQGIYAMVNALVKDLLKSSDAIHVPPEVLNSPATLDLHAPLRLLPAMGPARPYVTFSELLAEVARRAGSPADALEATSGMARSFLHMAGLRKGSKRLAADVLSSCPGVLVYVRRALALAV